MYSGDLLNQISCIKKFDLETIEILLAEIMRADVTWTEEYNEYQSGGWSTAALYSISGDPNDVVIRDGDGIPTFALGKLMPFTHTFIESLGLKIMYARLARLSENSFLWEHVDYTELDQKKRFRLHIPLVTNSTALLVIAGRALTLKPGYMWLLEPVKPHGVCNLYGPDRIHIIIDCYQNETLDTLMNQKQLSDVKIVQLPALEKPALDEAVGCSKKLLEFGFSSAAENNLLKLFFRYSMPTGKPYDLIVDMYKTGNWESETLYWEQKRRTMLNL